MIVEHKFVTTLDESECWGRIRAFLTAEGFVEQTSDDGALTFRRGKSKPEKARTIWELPQQIRLEFDRGRVTFAVSILTRRKPKPIHRDFLLALATAIEELPASPVVPTARPVRWNAVCQEIDAAAARRKRWVLLLVIILVLVLFAMIVAIALAVAAS